MEEEALRRSMSSQESHTVGEPPALEPLSEKQLEAVRAATEAGFFARPQEATAEEVAEQLDVSRSTFLYHLRGAEEVVFERLLKNAPESADW